MYYLFSFFIFLLSNMNFFHYQTNHYSWHIIRILNTNMNIWYEFWVKSSWEISFHTYLHHNCHWTTEIVSYFFSFFTFLVNNMNFFYYQTIHYSWHIIRIANNYSSSKIQRIWIRIIVFGSDWTIRIIRIIRIFPPTLIERVE